MSLLPSVLNVVALVPKLYHSLDDLIFQIAFTDSSKFITLTTLPSKTVNIPENTHLIVVCGPSQDVLQPTFLASCQAVIGNNVYKGPKILMTDTIPTTVERLLYPYAKLFDRILTFDGSQLSESVVATQKQIQHPVLTGIQSLPTQNISRRRTRPSSIGIYIAGTIGERNPYFPKNICTSLTAAIYQTLILSTEAPPVLTLFAFSSKDKSLCIDLIESFGRLNARYTASSITVIDGTELSLSSFLQTCTTAVDGMIVWDTTVSIVAAMQDIPCVVFRSKDANNTPLLTPLDANEVQFSMSSRYNKPQDVDHASLTKALENLNKGVGGLQVSNNARQAADLYSYLMVTASKPSSIIVGPLPWTTEEHVTRPHSTLIHSAQSAPALHSTDIRKRAESILQAMQGFTATRSQFDGILVARFACFLVTLRSEPSKYAYGLATLLRSIGRSGILDPNTKELLDALRWLVKDAYTNGLTYDYPSVHRPLAWLLQENDSCFKPSKSFKINMDYVFRQSDFTGVHRSGWAYVKNGLAVYNDAQCTDFVDLYADATFGWMADILAYSKAIPYKASWVGFFHHAWDTTESYSVKSAVARPVFRESLPSCKAIITLTEDLRIRLESGLQELYPNATLPPIVVMTHPTEFVPSVLQFTMGNLRTNPNPKVVQVGSFYRESFAIYALPIGTSTGFPNPLGLKKAHLQSADSGRYFQPPNLKKVLTDLGNQKQKRGDDDGTEITASICGSPVRNDVDVTEGGTDTTDHIYMRGLIDHLDDMHSTVEIIPNLSNDDYDILLSQNVVFVKLTDASAINTLIECVVRNTPLLINPLPAVVEALGPNYPLYYRDLRHAAMLLADSAVLERTTQYLSGLDKTRYRLDYFLMDFKAKIQPFLGAIQ